MSFIGARARRALARACGLQSGQVRDASYARRFETKSNLYRHRHARRIARRNRHAHRAGWAWEVEDAPRATARRDSQLELLVLGGGRRGGSMSGRGCRCLHRHRHARDVASRDRDLQGLPAGTGDRQHAARSAPFRAVSRGVAVSNVPSLTRHIPTTHIVN